jgi:N-acylglucosamine-6-phosphate 2-epimerase
MSMTDTLIARIRGGVLVSCQAGWESPLNAPHFIAALAKSAERGGAAGFRVDGPENIAAVRAVSELPILGIYKVLHPGFDVFITSSFADARAAVDAGANLVALDGTSRPRPGGEHLGDIIERLHLECGVPVMTDIATVEEGLHAVELGADLVATTLAGYTPYSQAKDGPALDVVRGLVAHTSVPVIVEGRIWTVDELHACFVAGAWAVVIGSAITVPEFITRRFVAAIPTRDELPSSTMRSRRLESVG